jgi:predicted dehydrogenase
MKQYRIAFIGTGNIVGSHLQAVQQAGERAQLVAAVDVDGERVQAICEANAIPYWYTDAAQMLAAVQPDLVHILTPPATHFPLIMQSLAAGAAVYCEKPLCASLDQFDRITAAEAASGKYVSTVFQWRFGSAARHLKQLMAAGELGRPLVGQCHTLWYRDAAYYAVPWRGRWATEIGGPTMGLGIHLTDLFLWLMDEWEEVRAIAATLDREIEVEDIAIAMVRFGSGALGQISNSALSPRQESYLRLDFQRATVECSALYRYQNANWCFSIADQSPDGEALAHWQAIETDISGSHAVQLGEILDSMDRGERPFVSGDEARRIIEFSTSLYKSAFTNQPVQRGSITPVDPFYYAMNGKPQD